MAQKTRFVVMLEPSQLAMLRQIDAKHGIRPSEQIRRAVGWWLQFYQDEHYFGDPSFQLMVKPAQKARLKPKTKSASSRRGK